MCRRAHSLMPNARTILFRCPTWILGSVRRPCGPRGSWPTQPPYRTIQLCVFSSRVNPGAHSFNIAQTTLRLTVPVLDIGLLGGRLERINLAAR